MTDPESDQGGSEDTTSEDDAQAPTREELKRAMKAFRKRLKIMLLDDESGLGGGHLTGGRQSKIAAITPPDRYREEVWEELVRQGRLRYSGDGLYELDPSG